MARVDVSLGLVPAPELINGGQCFRRMDAAAAGLSLRQFRALLDAGELRQVVRGVLVDARRDDELAVRVAAVDLVRPPDAVIARRTAAWLRGIDIRGPGEARSMDVECMVPPGRTPMRRPGVRCYTAPLDGDVEDVAGVPCTTSLRTTLDLLRYLPPHLGSAPPTPWPMRA